jgi:lysophospholipid acyltransferase (LPLAT)-like uncharacterized protein
MLIARRVMGKARDSQGDLPPACQSKRGNEELLKLEDVNITQLATGDSIALLENGREGSIQQVAQGVPTLALDKSAALNPFKRLARKKGRQAAWYKFNRRGYRQLN